NNTIARALLAMSTTTRIIRPNAINQAPDLNVYHETKTWGKTSSLTIYSYKMNIKSFGELLQKLPELRHLRLVDVHIDPEEIGEALPISKWLNQLELVRTTPNLIMLRAMSAVVDLEIRNTDPDFPVASLDAYWRFNRVLFEVMVQYMAALNKVTVDGFVMDPNRRPRPKCDNKNVTKVVNKTGVDLATYFPNAISETA
ncbi:hypothetical protein BG004_006497, partial [Podila humilis]